MPSVLCVVESWAIVIDLFEIYIWALFVTRVAFYLGFTYGQTSVRDHLAEIVSHNIYPLCDTLRGDRKQGGPF